MDLVNFGTFQIDLEERRIYTTAGELPVEPKVVDVLCYLIQNSDRFVSLQELHAEVWTGRVVTDTAVRRTISKLRAVLGDTDTEAPLFIKSQMKRGYQFIGQPLPAETSEASPISPVVADGRLDLTTSETSPAARPKPVRFWYGLLSVALLALVFWSLQFTQQAHEKPVMTTEPLVSIAGEKHFLSVSENGRYQAFTGRLNKTEGWQPYLYDNQLGHLQKISVPKDVYFPLVSIVANQTVVVSTTEHGEGKLYLYSIANLNKPDKSMNLKEFVQIGHAVSYQENSILINGLKVGSKNIVYYKFNLDDEILEQFTFSPSQTSTDTNIVVSPDKKHFAFIRRDLAHHVQIYRTLDKALVFDELFDLLEVSADDINLAWLDNDQLLINNNQQSNILSISTNTKVQLQQSERFSGFARSSDGKLFGLLKKTQNKRFFELQMPMLDSAKSYFNFTEQVQSVNYSQLSDSLWLVENDNSNYQLLRYHPSTGEKKLYFNVEDPFYFVTEGHDSSYVLLLHNKQLKIFEPASGKLTSISYENQNIGVSRVVPSLDDSKIFFSEKVGDEWQVNAFDRKTKSLSLILKGYLMLQPWRDKFIAVDAKGLFYLLDDQYQLVKQLPPEIDLSLKHHISVRGDKLIVANIGADSFWRILTLDLSSEQYQQHITATLPIKTKFSFKNDGSAAIVMAVDDDENQLVRVGYNFGYN